jgi:hypothetical protein
LCRTRRWRAEIAGPVTPAGSTESATRSSRRPSAAHRCQLAGLPSRSLPASRHTDGYDAASPDEECSQPESSCDQPETYGDAVRCALRRGTKRRRARHSGAASSGGSPGSRALPPLVLDHVEIGPPDELTQSMAGRRTMTAESRRTSPDGRGVEQLRDLAADGGDQHHCRFGAVVGEIGVVEGA